MPRVDVPDRFVFLPPIIGALCRVVLLGLVCATSVAAQQGTFYEVEPNNTPAEANAIKGALVIAGTMAASDQDGFTWTVSDDDARKRWTFELQGIPGALTIAEVVRVEFASDGLEVTKQTRLMKMGTRDGATPAIARDLVFEPGEYLIGLAHAGGGSQEKGGMFRPPTASLSFGESGQPQAESAVSGATTGDQEPGGYRFIIREGSRLAVSKHPGPRASRENAQTMRLDREFATFETGEKAWYAFEFKKKDAAQRWDIPVQVPVGRSLKATLYDTNGSPLSTASTDSRGHLVFPDLAPDITTYFVELQTENPDFIHAIASASVGQRITGEEAEPNGKWELASRADFSQAVTGRIGEVNEWDFFRFTLDEAAVESLLNLRLETTTAGQDLEFCLLGEGEIRVQCRREKSPIELPNLVLTPGTWGLSVTRAKAGIEYRISLSEQGAIQPGTETEPNDAVEFASSVAANNRVKGQFSDDESDFFRFVIVDDPQLWRFQVIGDDITEVMYYDGAGKKVARVRPGRDQRRVRLDNLFLLPGQHFLSVSGRDGGEYTVLARALGPPDPNGEHEPNDDTRMQRLAIGQTRTGLLSEEGDSDYYRFFLGNWDHVKLTITPPADGIVDPQLYWYDSSLADGKPTGAGEPVTLSGLFPPGDYHIVLRPRQVSDAEYKIQLERLPRFSCPADCEPNGVKELWLAAPITPNRVLEGRTGQWGDLDEYALPVLDQETVLFVRSAEPVRRLLFGTNRFAAETLGYDADRGGYPVTVPAGKAYRLIVSSDDKDYRLELEFPDQPKPATLAPLPVELELALDHEQVSAYRPLGQTVNGTLTVQNRGAEPVELDLEAATSDYRWEVVLDSDQASVPANGNAAVGVHLDVPPDAWADRPVRISVRAVSPAGSQAETWAELGVAREIAPVGATQGWRVPGPLRGGLNAAWAPFGAELTGDLPRGSNYPNLFDGLVFSNARTACCGQSYGWGDDPRPALTLDLPGDDLMPVAGVALNHFGSPGQFQDVRQATLLLSLDGNAFEEVLHIDTEPVETEQFFSLDAPVMARFARLRIDETFNLRSGSASVTLGEWKVILSPGHDLSDSAGFNIADPALGGHVVFDVPPRAYLPAEVLDEDPKWHLNRLRDGDIQEYVVGFHHNRAAQIERVEWVYGDDVTANQKFESVTVSVSSDSSVGPWAHLGELPIAGEEPSTVLALDAPIWARFVKFSASQTPGRTSYASPAVIRIRERPTGDNYRSVLGEWGYGSPRGYYELQAGLPAEPDVEAADNSSRASAAPLTPGERVAGQVQLAENEHWYRLKIPAGENMLTLRLSGDSSVRTRVALETAEGNPIPARRLVQQSITREHVFEAVVEPGKEIWLHVFEPPRNVVFSWDTSSSVGRYLPTIYNSLAAFSSQVVPGQEAVNLVPFGRTKLLRDWHGEPYVLQTILNDYPRSESSSSAEWTLKQSAEALAPLAGTKSIVVITDGITVHDGSMWAAMREVQPRIFGVHIGGSEGWNQNVFEDWAAVNSGAYTQLYYRGEMEIAFDRAATLMRRPASYTLLAETGFREAPGPGRLRLVNGADASPSGGIAVELILDASGSMLQRMDGKRRINVAREVLVEAVTEHIPAGTPVALRVFGHREPDACRTDLEIPLGPLDPAQATRIIQGIQAMNLARTPIADSLAAVERDLKGVKGRVAVVLVTDGEETCEGDPAKVIETLQAKGIDVHLNIVGFAIDNAELAAQFESWANLAGGKYFSARNQAGLSGALREALQVPFTVYDATGTIVAEGVVGGGSVELEQGVYRVQVETSPPQVFEEVEIPGEKETLVTLE